MKEEQIIKTPLSRTPNKENKEKNSNKQISSNNLASNNNMLIKNEEVDGLFFKPKKESFNSNKEYRKEEVLKKEEQAKKDEAKKIDEKDRENERKEMMNDIKQRVGFPKNFYYFFFY